MALRFESAGTCLIVRQYLERSRNILRCDLVEKIQLLFSHSAEMDKPNQKDLNQSQMLAEDELSHAGKANGTAGEANTMAV
jgi:hypothetical protein